MIRINFIGGKGAGKTTFRKFFESVMSKNGIEFDSIQGNGHGESDALMLPTTEKILEHVRSLTKEN